MLGIKKKAFPGKGKKVFWSVDKFCLGGDNVAGALLAMESVNCDCSDGTIKNGLGLSMLQLNGNYVPISFSGRIHGLYLIDGSGVLNGAERAEKLFCVPQDEKMYYYDESNQEFVYKFDAAQGSRYCMVANSANEWYAFFTAKDGGYLVNGPYFSYVKRASSTNAVCFCKGRTFWGQKQRRLWYSKSEEPWTFSEVLDESGAISLPYDFGEIVALINYRDHVYVFMDYGVAEVDVTGSPLDFKIRALDYSGGKIFGASVGLCNNHIMFLTESGVVRFNGSRFERVAKNLRISPKRDTQVCGYAVCGDNYIVRYQAISAERRTAVVKANGDGYFITDREGLTQSGGKALCAVNGYIYEIVSDGHLIATERVLFRSQKTDFGIPKKKFVRSVRIEGEGGYTFYLCCDGVWRHNTVAFENGVAVIPMQQSGKEFAFEFQLEQGAVIRKVTVEMSVTA